MKNFFYENKHNSDIQERYKNISDFLRNNLQLCLQFVFISLNESSSLSETFKFQSFLHLQETTSKRVFVIWHFKRFQTLLKVVSLLAISRREKNSLNNQSVFSGLFPIKLCCQSMLILQCTVFLNSCLFYLNNMGNSELLELRLLETGFLSRFQLNP